LPRASLALDYSHDGRALLVGTGGGTLRLWDPAGGAPRSPELRQRGVITALFFNRDASRFAYLSGGTLVRCDAATGRPLGPRMPAWAPVAAPAVRLDVGRAAAADTTNDARLWDLASAKPIGPPLPHRGRISALALSPDGTTLVAGDESGEVRIWSFPPPVPGAPDRVSAWAQVLTGMELGPDGAPRHLDPATYDERRRAFAAEGRDPMAAEQGTTNLPAGGARGRR
jgi:hypothetical protein